MTITINLSPDLESQLRAVSLADGIAPEEIVVGALSDRLKGSVPNDAPSSLSAEESKLLTVINEGISADRWQRYHSLLKRRDEESLAPDELQELIAICDYLEALNVTRLEMLTALARLRGVTLDQVMAQLGIRRPENG